MRRFYILAAVGLVACTGTVSLGLVPGGGGSDGPPEAGGPLLEASADGQVNVATCVGKTFHDDFESGFTGLSSTGAANLTSLVIDPTNPIDGAASMHIAPRGSGNALFAYLTYAQPQPTCRLTTSFELRATDTLIANGANILQVLAGTTGRAVNLHVTPGGTLSIVQSTNSPNGMEILATSNPVGQLVSGQVAHLTLSWDVTAATIALTVDGASIVAPLVQPSDLVPASLTNVQIGVTPQVPPAAAVDFWIDDIAIGTDPTVLGVLGDGGPSNPDGGQLVDSGSTQDSGTACGTATTYSEAFDTGFPTDVTFTDQAAMSIDSTTPIDGTSSLTLTSPADQRSYLSFAESAAPCALTLSFKIRPQADLISGGGNIAVIKGPMRSLTLAFAQGKLALTTIENDGIGTRMSAGQPLYPLTAGTVSAITLTLDATGKTASLTVDGQTSTEDVAGANTVDPHLTSVLLGADPQFGPPLNVGTYDVDDISIH